MASGFPVRVNDVRILTVEALYQACRFPHRPEVQKKILSQHSPMTAKMVSKPYRDDSRTDWQAVRVKVMRWCLRVKFAQHPTKFSELLLSTGGIPIVEDSRKDDFWGAMPRQDGKLVGMNVLGRLLMELREFIIQGEELRFVATPFIPDFLLLGQAPEVLDFRLDKTAGAEDRLKVSDERLDDLSDNLFASNDSKATADPRQSPEIVASKQQRRGLLSGLKPYSNYKDSGLLWLGEVPKHWEVLPIGRVGRMFKGNGGTKEDETGAGVPCVRYGDLYTRHEFFIRDTKACVKSERADSYTSIRRGDVLFAASGETLDDIGRSAVNLMEHAAVCGGDIIVLRPTVEFVPEFMGYVCDAPASRQQKAMMGRGFTVVHIYGSQLKKLTIPIPPPAEQECIVKVLAAVDRRVNRLVRAKRRLLKLLAEQKQAVITHTITRGLNPDAPTKPSGVAWLGDVPEHWVVLPLKRWVVTPITDGPHETPALVEDGVDFVSAESMVRGRIDFSRRRGFITPREHERFCRKLRPLRNDIFMCKSGATTGKVAIVDDDREFSVWSPLALVRCDPTRVVPRLMFYVLGSPPVQENVQLTWSYGTQPNLSMAAMERLVIALPPESKEQRKLVESIECQTSTLDAAADLARREIDLIREYRTRLVADVVTGTLDVRAVAAALPDEDTDECVQAADTNDLGDDDDPIVETDLEAAAC